MFMVVDKCPSFGRVEANFPAGRILKIAPNTPARHGEQQSPRSLHIAGPVCLCSQIFPERRRASRHPGPEDISERRPNTDTPGPEALRTAVQKLALSARSESRHDPPAPPLPRKTCHCWNPSNPQVRRFTARTWTKVGPIGVVRLSLWPPRTPTCLGSRTIGCIWQRTGGGLNQLAPGIWRTSPLRPSHEEVG